MDSHSVPPTPGGKISALSPAALSPVLARPIVLRSVGYLFLTVFVAAGEARSEIESSTGPILTDLRAFQPQYAIEGGPLWVEWKVAGGEFHHFYFRLDGGLPEELAPEVRGVEIPFLPVGSHEIVVEAVDAGGRQERRAGHETLTSSPITPVDSIWTIFYAADQGTRQGHLQISWRNPSLPVGDPYVEYVVEIDDGPRWLFSAPDEAVTFSGIFEGAHQVRITAGTRSYAAPPADFISFSQVVPPPQYASVVTGCAGNAGRASLTYRMEPGARYDAVAVWLTTAQGRKFYDYFAPKPSQIQLEGLPDGFISVELAGALFDFQHNKPFALSNFPGTRAGVHSVAHGRVACSMRSEFRRGDFSDDGSVNIADPIRILAHLFQSTIPNLACPAAGDVDDSGQLDITDGVGLLGFLFLNGEPPAPPGVFGCGADPTPLDLGECVYNSCGEGD